MSNPHPTRDSARNVWPTSGLKNPGSRDLPKNRLTKCRSWAKAAGRLSAAGVDREVRGWEHASDHAPAWIELADKTVRRAVAKQARQTAAEASAPVAKAASLEQYRGKRDFEKTPEPGATVTHRTGSSFVIQKHHARARHFDLRLEMDGVLVSWAVPKGIPEDTETKRLAVHVEDHPLEYGKFEATIPKGNYGAGTVAIWDKGEWEPMDPNKWRRDFEKGTLKDWAKSKARPRQEFVICGYTPPKSSLPAFGALVLTAGTHCNGPDQKFWLKPRLLTKRFQIQTRQTFRFLLRRFHPFLQNHETQKTPCCF